MERNLAKMAMHGGWRWVGLAIALMGSGCMSNTRRELEAYRVKAHAGALELHGPKGSQIASIGSDGAVTIDGHSIALDQQQHASTLSYRQAALQLVDLSLSTATQLTRFAIPRFLFDVVVHGGADSAADSIAERSDKAVHSPDFCNALENVLDKQGLMVAQVPKLRPYTHLTSKDIIDCRAGRPYGNHVP